MRHRSRRGHTEHEASLTFVNSYSHGMILEKKTHASSL